MILSIYPTGFPSGICPTKQGRRWVHVASNTSYILLLFVCSEDAYRASREHTMSVVLGDDLVPRLSIQTMQDLKVSVMTAINDCPHPKVTYKSKCCKPSDITCKTAKNAVIFHTNNSFFHDCSDFFNSIIY